MYRLMSVLAIAFFAFILWIIFLANTGSSSVFFAFVSAIPYGDKFGHFGLFGVLALLSIVGLRFRTLAIGKFKIYHGCLLVALFAVGEEISQAFISSRTFDLIDLAADFVGISLAAGLAFLANKYLTA